MDDNSGGRTLSQIANLAGVGLGTASRALSGAPGVAPATRQRVIEVAEQHSYVVSPDAANLAGRASRRIAVVVPHLSRWFFGEMLEGLETILRDAEFDVLLYQVGDLMDRQQFFERLPARRKVDAVVVLAARLSEVEQERFELMGVHIIAAGGQHATYPYVCIDDVVAGRQAMDHLLMLGHTRIAMIEAVDPDQPRFVSGRSTAYYDALRQAGIPVDESLVVEVDWGAEHGADGMAQLLSGPGHPTAVYAHSDEVAVGAMRTIRRLGLRIPEDISIVGIDDHPVAAMVDLTTVRQPVREQGTIAGRIVLGLLREEHNVDRAVVVSTRLVIRASTARYSEAGRPVVRRQGLEPRTR